MLSGERQRSTRAPPDSRADSTSRAPLPCGGARAPPAWSPPAPRACARGARRRGRPRTLRRAVSRPRKTPLSGRRRRRPHPRRRSARGARRRTGAPSRPSRAWRTQASGCHATASNVPPAPACARARASRPPHKSHAVVPAKQATREKRRAARRAARRRRRRRDASKSPRASLPARVSRPPAPRGSRLGASSGIDPERGPSPSTPRSIRRARAAGAFRSSTPFSREAAVPRRSFVCSFVRAVRALARGDHASDLIRGGAWFAPIGCDSWISSKGVSSTSSRASVRRHARIRPSAPAETTAFSDSRTASARTPWCFARRVPDARRGAASAWPRGGPPGASARAYRGRTARGRRRPCMKVPAGQNAAACAREGRRAVEAQRRPPHRPAPSRRHSLTCLAPKVTNSNELVADGRSFRHPNSCLARRAEDAMGGAPARTPPGRGTRRDVAGFGTAFATFRGTAGEG